jgi:TonB-dependent receptor
LPLDLTFRNILGYLTRTQIQTAVGGSYNLTSDLTVDARLDFARAKVDNEETDSTGVQYGTPSSTVTYAGPNYAPDIQLPGTDLIHGSGINELQAYYVPVTNTSREIAEQANLKYKPEWASWLTLKAGLFRHDYTVVETSWGKGTELTCRGAVSAGNKTIVAVPCSTIQGIEASTATTNKIPFYNTGNLGFSDEVRTWLNQTQATVLATIAAATAAGMPNANIYNLTTINPVANTNMSYETYTANWSVGEGTTDWYGQADFDFPDFYLPVSGNVGLREVDTHTTTTGYTSVTNTSFAPQANPASCPAPCTTYPVATLKGHYTQALPSANLKVDILPDELIARFAYGKVMARPAPSQIDIGRTTDIVGLTGKQGNPSLLPFLSTDYDAGLEWYISKLNYISVGFFQKNISRFILNTTQPLTIDNVTYSMTFPTNSTVPVKITGIEAGVQYAFDWLPKPFDGFGFTANMTSQKDKGFNQKSLIDGSPLPFPGLSRTAENASVYYENDDFTTRLSYVWRSKWLINASGRGNLPEYNASYGELDASGSYNINDNLSVFVDAINLLDAQLVQYNAPARPIQFDTFGSRLYFGVRAKY